MPYKPKRPCSYPGCPRLTSGRYCEEHQKIITAHYNKHQRDPASKRRYGRAWKRIRDRYIAAHPLCEQCRRARSRVAVGLLVQEIRGENGWYC